MNENSWNYLPLILLLPTNDDDIFPLCIPHRTQQKKKKIIITTHYTNGNNDNMMTMLVMFTCVWTLESIKNTKKKGKERN